MNSVYFWAARRKLVCLVASVSVLAMAGCAAVPEESRPASDIVKERAQARWDMLLKGDIGAAYAYLSPGSRAVMSEKGYENSVRSGFWKSAQVQDVECRSPEACEAHVMIGYRFRGSPFTTPLSETWVKQDSNWWFVQK